MNKRYPIPNPPPHTDTHLTHHPASSICPSSCLPYLPIIPPPLSAHHTTALSTISHLPYLPIIPLCYTLFPCLPFVHTFPISPSSHCAVHHLPPPLSPHHPASPISPASHCVVHHLHASPIRPPVITVQHINNLKIPF